MRLIIADERFRFYGDAALLTEVERYGEGEDFPGYRNDQRLWVRRGGEWKLIHMHFFQAERVVELFPPEVIHGERMSNLKEFKCEISGIVSENSFIGL